MLPGMPEEDSDAARARGSFDPCVRGARVLQLPERGGGGGRGEPATDEAEEL
jgi:hypothetical protein